MSESSLIVVIEPDPVRREALERAFARIGGLEGVVVVVEALPAQADQACSVVLGGGVVRFGALVDRVLALRQRLQGAVGGKVYPFGAYRLDPVLNTLERVGAAAIRLTDKERDILLILLDHKGAPVTREALLARVWAYAQGVETHTLETHIYRLRQKIEADPARPEYLMTSEQGYYIPTGLL